MSITISTLAHGLMARGLPVLLALQDDPRPHSAAPSSGGGVSGATQGGMFQLLLPLLMIVFLYFVMIRPANKQRKEQESLHKGLQKGDKVVTTSGIVGTVQGVDDQFVTLEISEKVRVKFLRESVARRLDTTTATSKAAAGATTAEAKK